MSIGIFSQIWAISRKELHAYFGSPLAVIFIGVFLAASLFIFFWVETFFTMNLAEVRPLFRWMPILMIFLVGTLTMRQWSEEKRSGTFELLLTLPVRRFWLVMGKFLAVMLLLMVALFLTLILPITVANLGNLDWGPVAGGYIASILLAAAYVSIGLFVSSRTDNQIVSFILTTLVCGILYLIGTAGITNFVDEIYSNIFGAISTGSRFESIERGVLDLRDLIYYASLTTFFLLLNVTALDINRWSKGQDSSVYKRNSIITVALTALHLIALNCWMFPMAGLRVDLTADRQFSLSNTTRDVLANIQEPLLLRGYLSDQTHPLLSPLVPNIEDMMREYEIAGKGKIVAEVIDPKDDEEIGDEASRAYGIRPTSFAVAERHQAGVVNSYFDILVRYGDQFVTLGFDDLTQVKSYGDGQIEIRLRDLEYGITKGIKRVISGFQNESAVFQSLDSPISMTAFITYETIPEEWGKVPESMQQVASEIIGKSDGMFQFQIIDPDSNTSPVSRQDLEEIYGLTAIPVSLASNESYYLHLLLEKGGNEIVGFPGGTMNIRDIRNGMESMVKRSTPGFLRTVGLVMPAYSTDLDPYGQEPPPALATWNHLERHLSTNYQVLHSSRIMEDLSYGRVPDEIDVLIVISGYGLTEVQEFAIDQFLMRGGSLVVISGRYILSPWQYAGGLTVDAVNSRIHEIIDSYGITVVDAFLMDTQNEPVPMEVSKEVGGSRVLEFELFDYPFWVDVREDGMNDDSLITAALPSVTIQWASPLEIKPELFSNKDVSVLLKSSEESWLRRDEDINPDTQTYPDMGFPIQGEQKSWPIAVSARGSFKSFFADKTSPLDQGETESENISQFPSQAPVTIKESPDNAKLVVVGSSEFLDDFVLDMSNSITADRYLLNLNFIESAVDWAVEDDTLLSIRSRGTVSRFLKPLEDRDKTFWEILNYSVALGALLVIALIWTLKRRVESPMELVDTA